MDLLAALGVGGISTELPLELIVDGVWVVVGDRDVCDHVNNPRGRAG